MGRGRVYCLVQAGGFNAVVLLAGTAVGALSTNLLVINNHRDVETDIKANKRTLAVRFGRGFSALEYRSLFALALVCAMFMAALSSLYFFSVFAFCPQEWFLIFYSQIKSMISAKKVMHR